jgi:hypothetical protein
MKLKYIVTIMQHTSEHLPIAQNNSSSLLQRIGRCVGRMTGSRSAEARRNVHRALQFEQLHQRLPLSVENPVSVSVVGAEVMNDGSIAARFRVAVDEPTEVYLGVEGQDLDDESRFGHRPIPDLINHEQSIAPKLENGKVLSSGVKYTYKDGLRIRNEFDGEYALEKTTDFIIRGARNAHCINFNAIAEDDNWMDNAASVCKGKNGPVVTTIDSFLKDLYSGNGYGLRPWQGADTSGDGEISPVDALKVINWVNDDSRTERPGSGVEFLEPEDVNGDGHVTPIDVLNVVNVLNQSSNEILESEGSFTVQRQGESNNSLGETELQSNVLQAETVDRFFSSVGRRDNKEENLSAIDKLNAEDNKEELFDFLEERSNRLDV